MTSPARVPGKRGRLRSEPLRMGFLHEYTGPLTPPSYPVDVRGGIPDDAWGMLGNGPDPACTVAPDGVGDCGYAGRQHLRMAKAACYGETETWEASNQVVDEYLAYDHGQDDGVSLAAVLLSWFHAGKILAFAPVDHASPAAMDSAMHEFKGLYCGADLTDDADELFGQGQPWTVAGGQQPDSSDGHCIVKVYADDPASGDSAEDGWVTWGALQKSAKDWTRACLREAYVLITSEDEAAKVDMPRLLQDIRALGGTEGQQPQPKEGPVPDPVPAPVPAPRHGVVAWFEDHLVPGLKEALADAEKARTLIPALEAWLPRLEALAADVAPEVAAKLGPLVTELQQVLAAIASA